MKFVSDSLKDRLTRPLKELPHPGKESLRHARELAEYGLNDVDSAKANYNAGRFANAAEDLQQSVEKGAKAFGLIIGTIEPTEEQLKYKKGVRHLAYRALILNFWNFYPRVLNLPDMLRDATQMEELHKPVMIRTIKKLQELVDNLRKTISKDNIDAEIEELRNLDEESMWKATLNFDRSNTWVLRALNEMDQNPILDKTVSWLIPLANQMKKVGFFSDEDVQLMKFASNLGKASLKLFSLSLLTTWHYEPARYPPIGKSDYWYFDSYKKGVPYVDKMPDLIKAAKSALKGIIGACKSAPA
ncbi:MAG: hypothetical protein JRM78_04165 [Nitrososphaerota archaeon]|nr:hypothetical protein [Nitrososphaerota archaeon]MDG7047627.1 hypothetical protein [Nitrososphaerota archaeon]